MALQAGLDKNYKPMERLFVRLSSGALRRLEQLGLLGFFQHAGDGGNRGAGFDGGGTGDARNQRLAEFLWVAQIRVGLDERFLVHGKIIA